MPIVVFATSGPAGEVGLLLPDGRLVTAALGEGAARGRGVFSHLDALLRSEGLAPGDLRAVVADVGPGSFTGVRVGVTAAKTLAWALGLPVVGVASLAALARGAPPDRTVLAVRDAGRGTVYRAVYGPLSGARREVLVPPGRCLAEQVLSLWPGSLLVGEEAPEVQARIGGSEAFRTAATAAAVLAEARADLDEGRTATASALAPLYLQASAPERLRAGETDHRPAATP